MAVTVLCILKQRKLLISITLLHLLIKLPSFNEWNTSLLFAVCETPTRLGSVHGSLVVLSQTVFTIFKAA